ncbi:MAG: hypothetical protein XD61_1560 [Thermococcus sp. 40_45]|nr:MAG: hypothetical protein XD61_1560 [Thermococcus sp. 40_45]
MERARVRIFKFCSRGETLLITLNNREQGKVYLL